MKAFLDSRQTEHDPKYFMSSGAVAPNPEQPKRVEILSAGAKNAGCVLAEFQKARSRTIRIKKRIRIIC